MDKPKKYEYRCRSEYGSDNLLIEFVNGFEYEGFIADLFDSIKEINPKIASHEDLWMNDEILCTINSDMGKFILSRDIWGLAFLITNDNQICILQIDNLLLDDIRFDKIEVDFNYFKLNEKISTNLS